MKYKQRLFVSIVLPCFILSILLLIYSSSPQNYEIKSWINTDLSSLFLRQDENEYEYFTPVCQADGLYRNVSADLISNKIYDLVSKGTSYSRKSRRSRKKQHLSQRKVANITSYGDELLTVLVIPHSHIDPGWIWTIDKYYNEKTRHILDNSVDFLTSYPDMTMLWVETVFLDMWWKENTHQRRMQMKKLIENGQFEIVSGGWVSVDEAITHYTAVLDQLIEGHSWLKETFDIFPETSWSLDPFGYSSSLPYLWKKSGMKGINVVRIYKAVKDFMAERRMLTFNWRQPWDFKGKHDILTHAEPNTLFCIAESCGPNRDICMRLDFAKKGDLPKSDHQPININFNLVAKNIEHFAQMLARNYREKSLTYKHNVIIAPHGCDFRYDTMNEFEQTYTNMKRLMDIINANKEKWKVEIKFGNVKEYFRLKNERKVSMNIHERTVIGDFFPYSESSNIFWTGFFITRPFDKRLIRVLQELLRATEIITTFAIIKAIETRPSYPEKDDLNMLQEARRTHALMQHHDAITGTSTKETTVDYEKKMAKAMSDLQLLFSKGLEEIFDVHNTDTEPLFLPTFEYYQFDKPLRQRIVPIIDTGTKIVFSNSFSQERKEIVSVVIESVNVLVEDPYGNIVEAQINPFWESKKGFSSKIFELFFEVEVPPMGVSVYTLKQTSLSNHHATITSADKVTSQNIVFKNSFMKLTFSKTSGLLQSICLKSRPQKCTTVEINWLKYMGAYNDAYVFKTNGRAINVIPNTIHVVTGNRVSQVIVSHSYFRHVVTLYNGAGIQSMNIHVDNIATLDPSFDENVELIMQITTSIQNKDSAFYSDANGFHFIKREPRFAMPTGANFYPITSMVLLEDSDTRLAVHTAQPHGVASFKTGTLQFMIERVPPNSGKGLPEPVLDQKPAHSKFVIQVEPIKADLSSLINETNTQGLIIIPSMLNELVNNELQNPIFSTLFTGNVDLSHNQLQLIHSPLPCNIIFANFRNFVTSDLTFNGTGLTFRKLPYSCKFGDKFSKCVKSNINLNRLFQKHAKTMHIKKMTLSYVDEETKVSDVTNIDVEPMEMESYLVQWS